MYSTVQSLSLSLQGCQIASLVLSFAVTVNYIAINLPIFLAVFYLKMCVLEVEGSGGFLFSERECIH